MRLLYNIGIRIYTSAIFFASLFNSKARLWIEGRKNWKRDLEGRFEESDRVFWVHCASLGEFEQGRPVIEAIKERDKGIKILVTFFSPSGYEIRRDYEFADHVMYLPADTPGNVKFFIERVKPERVIFIKYEFWLNYLRLLTKLDIPHFLVSGIFRPGQHFFKWYGKTFLKVLRGFSHMFVQDEQSGILLKEYGINRVTVSGDTRFDRVYEISRRTDKLDLIEKFRGKEELIIAGSSWPAEEEFICRYINERGDRFRWIIAPHEIGSDHIDEIENRLDVKSVRYSDASPETVADFNVLIINNIGLLSSVYRYGALAIIGGGFGKGIHNVLEPASWGLPVIFGPNHQRFREAVGLLTNGGAFSFKNYDQFSNIMDSLLQNRTLLKESAEAAAVYVRSNLGATAIVVDNLV